MTGRPHVLRLFDAPLQNVVTTGINSETVEAMEVALKIDILQEAASNMGLSLLHDEIQEEDGSFTITANWEAIKPAEYVPLVSSIGLDWANLKCSKCSYPEGSFCDHEK